MIDLDAVRGDTAGCWDRIFLDSAGSSLPPAPVLGEVTGHLYREAEIGGYRAAAEREADLEAGYSVFAELLDCEPDEVAFTDSATRSWLSLVDSIPFETGDRILISQVEYAANAVALLRLAERYGATVELVPSDEFGQVDVAKLRAQLDERVRLVSLVHVPTNSGLINPVREVAAAAHGVGALVLLDACQSVGQLPVRVRELDVDLLSGTGRKWLRGPRGTGFLVVRRAVVDRLSPRLVDHTGARWNEPMRYELRRDARVHQLWECGVAERLGLIEAARYALRLGVDAIGEAVRDRAAQLRTGLATIRGVTIRDIGREHGGIVTFTVDGYRPERVRELLWDKDITVTVSPAEASRIDMTLRGLDAVVRASPHYFVSPQQIDATLDAVAAVTG